MQEEHLTFLETILQSSDLIENQEAAKYLWWLEKLLLQFHNTDLNPGRWNLSDFQTAKVLKMRFSVPIEDQTEELPASISLLQFYLKRNGKEEVFNVQSCYAEPASAMKSILLAFR
jgi:hypothetical protein